ncbi:hypothetical protein GOBAR_DD19765 [Gossypium barbadense]|nr:hypothetical protein GOBAR_DD19765 [Gossypium barbadense]
MKTRKVEDNGSNLSMVLQILIPACLSKMLTTNRTTWQSKERRQDWFYMILQTLSEWIRMTASLKSVNYAIHASNKKTVIFVDAFYKLNLAGQHMTKGHQWHQSLEFLARLDRVTTLVYKKK